jgi:uncharacterized membrane protein
MPREHDPSDAGDAPGFLVPCVRLEWRAPLRWLALGWRDLRAAPGLSLSMGLLVALISFAVSALAFSLGRFALLALLLSGFVFVAPLLGVGLYCVSRSLEAGRRPRLSDSLALARRVLGQAGVFALVQLVILLVWSRAGLIVHALAPPRLGETGVAWEFLAIGSLIGSIFAALTFAIAAFSLPLIADREVDMVTAGISSVHAVTRNPVAMLVWAALIVLLTALGFLTAFLGLIVILPWLAYATWHGYRETLDASAWPRIEQGGRP